MALRAGKGSGRMEDPQRGTVILVVILLILMLTGLGVLAMRHTRIELRSSGAYRDATTAAELAEGALAMIMTDMKMSSDYYQFMFSSSDATTAQTDAGFGDDLEYEIPISDYYSTTSDAGAGDAGAGDGGTGGSAGTIAELSGTLSESLSSVEALTEVRHLAPVLAPCPPGYSCTDEENYAWYYFTVNSTAAYGEGVRYDPALPLFESGRAHARGRVVIGPVSAYGR